MYWFRMQNTYVEVLLLVMLATCIFSFEQETGSY